jgi:hypothetical protein
MRPWVQSSVQHTHTHTYIQNDDLNRLARETQLTHGLMNSRSIPKVVLMEGVNSTMIYCKNFCICHNVPLAQQLKTYHKYQ